jgi:hypothetical protein
VTVGKEFTLDVGDITRSGERLVDETTLVVFTEVGLLLDGCTVGATPTHVGSLMVSFNITVRLLKDVEGRNAPNPSSSIPSFFPSSVGISEEPNSDGISTSQNIISLEILREHKKSLDLLPEVNHNPEL